MSCTYKNFLILLLYFFDLQLVLDLIDALRVFNRSYSVALGAPTGFTCFNCFFCIFISQILEMVPRRRRAAGQTTSRRRNRPSRFTRSVNRAAHGIRFTPSFDPPDYAAGPWWPITVVLGSTSDTRFNMNSVYTAALTQLSWQNYYKENTKENVPMELRLLSVRAWGLDKQPIQLTIYDRLGSGQKLAELSDYGTPVQYSRLGWKFGNVSTQDSVVWSDTNVLFEVTTSSTGKVLIYVQALIRTTNSPKPTIMSLTDFVTDMHV